MSDDVPAFRVTRESTRPREDAPVKPPRPAREPVDPAQCEHPSYALQFVGPHISAVLHCNRCDTRMGVRATHRLLKRLQLERAERAEIRDINEDPDYHKKMHG